MTEKDTQPGDPVRGKAAEPEAKRELKAGVFLSGVQALIYVFELAKSFVVPSVLGPTLFGVWKTLGLLHKYANMLHLGIFHATNREVPIALGREDFEHERKIRDSSFSIAVTLSLVVLAIPPLLYGFGYSFDGALDSLPLALGVGLWSALTLYGTLLDRYALARAKFKVLGAARLANGFVMGLGSIVFVLLWGVPGLVAAGVLAWVTNNLVFSRFDKKGGFRPRAEWKILKDLLRIGLPIFLNSTAATIYWSIDSLIIVILLGAKDLGIFSFALITFPLLQMVPNQLSSVMSQRMARQLGAKGKENPVHLGIFLEESQVLVQWVATAATLGAGLMFPPVVRTVFPDFAEAIPIAHILMFGYLFYRLRGFTGYILILLDRQVAYLVIQLLVLAANAGGDAWVIKAGYGLEEVAWVCAAGYILFGLVLTFFGYFQVYGGFRQALAFVLRILPVNLAVFFGFRAMESVFLGWQGILLSFLSALGLILAAFGYFWILFPGFRRSFAMLLADSRWAKWRKSGP